MTDAPPLPVVRPVPTPDGRADVGASREARSVRPLPAA
jgi:hypothetical protein